MEQNPLVRLDQGMKLLVVAVYVACCLLLYLIGPLPGQGNEKQDIQEELKDVEDKLSDVWEELLCVISMA